MIVEATGKVMQVLSKIEGVSAKTGKAWEKYTLSYRAVGYASYFSSGFSI